jgi:hypothetical protein
MAPVTGQLPVIDTANAQAAEPAWRHALSLFGDVKYPADFKRFDYVNPNAPKGGVSAADLARHLRQFQHRGGRHQGQHRGRGDPDLRNADGEVAGRDRHRIRPAGGSRAHPDDFSWVIYRLRKEARWHDGKPVTPEDVMFSLETLKKLSPFYAPITATWSRPRSQASATSSSPSTVREPRIADHRRRSPGSAEALLGRHRRSGPQARHSLTTLEKPEKVGVIAT